MTFAWTSKNQKSVALIITDAKHIAHFDAAKEATYIRKIIAKLNRILSLMVLKCMDMMETSYDPIVHKIK